MHCASRSIAARLVLMLAGGLAACTDSAAEEPRSAAGARAAAAPCPSPADIETAVGFQVKSVPMAIDGCMYELTGQYAGSFVTLMYQPSTRAEGVFADIRKNAKMWNGQNAEPDRLSLGEGGWGYGGGSRSEAAAISQGYLYHAEIGDAVSSMEVRADAAARVVALGIRTAPAGKLGVSSAGSKGGTPFDACTLASNKEVARIAAVNPQIAEFWSTPTASMGGSHCDYDGGSIRVYQGKTPAADLERTLKNFKADKEPRVPVAGIGDKAFFIIPMPYDKYNRLGLLAVYAGPRVVQLTLDANGNEQVALTQPRLEELARLVLPRLK